MFLAYLRAELYRLVRRKVFWIAVLFAFGTALAVVAPAASAALFPGTSEAVPAVDLTPATIGAYAILPFLVTVCSVSLANEEQRGQALKSIACRPGWQRSYVLAHAAVLGMVAGALGALQLAATAVACAAFGVALTPVAPSAIGVCFVGVALFAAGYAALPFAVSVGAGLEGLAMAFGVAWSLGLLDASWRGFMGLVAQFVPVAAPVANAVASCLLVSIAGLLKYPAELLGNPAALAQALLVPLGWLAASLALTLFCLRRRPVA